EQLAIRLRATLDNGHVEAMLAVGAVGDRLIEPAMRGFGEPRGPEGHFVEGLAPRAISREKGGRHASGDGGLPYWNPKYAHEFRPLAIERTLRDRTGKGDPDARVRKRGDLRKGGVSGGEADQRQIPADAQEHRNRKALTDRPRATHRPRGLGDALD